METTKTAYQHLNLFIGKWNTTGKIFSTGTNPEIQIKGTDRYVLYSTI